MAGSGEWSGSNHYTAINVPGQNFNGFRLPFHVSRLPFASPIITSPAMHLRLK
jgi:hypothetical protein